MTRQEKLKKAAVMAVMAFLEDEENSNKKKSNKWVESGRHMNMQNGYMSQSKTFR